MRVFISSIDGSGSGRTTRIFLPDCTNTSALIRQICKQLRTNKTCAIIKLKCHPYNLRIVEDWPLTHYRIKSGSTFIVDYPQRYQYSQLTQSVFDKIQEASEGFSDDENNAKLSFMSGKGQFDDSRYLQQCLNQLLQAIHQQQLDEVSRILKQEPDVDNLKHLQTLMNRKVSFLLNQLGDSGKNALHCAIQTGNIEIVSFLLIKGANPTILTLDEYSPLQLAILRHSPEIMRLLLMQPKTDINQVTSKSTALHLAVLNEDMECLLVLLQNGIDIDIPNETGKSALDICSNQNMRTLLIKKAQLLKTVLPYISKGNIFKVTSFAYNLKKRILVINPFKNQLTVYKYNSSEVEEKHRLNDVIRVEPIRERKWLMSDQIYYLRISFRQDDTKLLLGVRHQKIYKMWMNNFENSLIYVSNSIFNKQVPISEQMLQYLNDHRGQATLHRRKLQQTCKTSKMQMSIMNLKFDSQIEPSKDQLKDKDQASFIQITTITKQPESSEQARLRQSDLVLGSITDFKPRSSISSSKPQQCPEDNNLAVPSKQNRFRKKSEQPVELLAQFKQRVRQPTAKSFKQQSRQSIQSPPKELIKTSPRCQKQALISFRDFRIIRLLGNGAFGQVYLARHRPSQSFYALKVLNKAHLISKRQLKYAVGEVNILKKMDSPFIIRLHYAFQTPKNLYMALDNCSNGDLSQLVITKGKLQEETAKFIIAQLILALQHLHSHNILYRDMKPQNILIGKDGYIQLTDFGLSKQNNFSMSFCGSPAYLSPEMLQKKGVTFANDIYGLGCVLFELTTGDPPYFDENLDVLYQNIKSGKLLYPSHLSIEIKSLLSKLLERDVNRRLGAKDINQIKRHDFFKNFNWQKLAKKSLPVPSEMFVNDQQRDLYQPVSLYTNQTELIDEDYKQQKGGSSVLCRIKNFTFIREKQHNNIY